MIDKNKYGLLKKNAIYFIFANNELINTKLYTYFKSKTMLIRLEIQNNKYVIHFEFV